MFTDCSLSPVCLHALSIENLAARRAPVARRSRLEASALDTRRFRRRGGVIGEGNRAFKTGDYEGAIKWYKMAVDKDPEDPKPHRNLAHAYSKVEKDDLAIKEFERCIEVSPVADPYDYFNLGQLCYGTQGGQFGALMWLGKFVEAAEAAHTGRIEQGHLEEAKGLLKELESRSYEKRDDYAPGFSRSQRKLTIEDGRLYLE